MRTTIRLSIALVICFSTNTLIAHAQLTQDERKASVGDSPKDPGPLASDLSPTMTPTSVRHAMKKVGDWQSARIQDAPSQDWTFATLYVGMLAASDTLHDQRYRDTVLGVARHYHWKLGQRETHADDQAIGQAYVSLYHAHPGPQKIAPLQTQFDRIMLLPDDPSKPVWWWCDALFMAPPVWAGISTVSHDPKYLAYMDHEWRITADLLWDPSEKLFFRDSGYFDKREKNGKKVFWSRGNGWVMGGLVRVLQEMPVRDSRRSFYVSKLQDMASTMARLQGSDGLWRPGLLDADSYPLPETSGSAFVVYAMAWALNEHLLDPLIYTPMVRRGWAGLVGTVYADGRLGCVQPVGERPGNYTAGSSYAFGTGAFLLAGSEIYRLSKHGLARSRPMSR